MVGTIKCKAIIERGDLICDQTITTHSNQFSTEQVKFRCTKGLIVGKHEPTTIDDRLTPVFVGS